MMHSAAGLQAPFGCGKIQTHKEICFVENPLRLGTEQPGSILVLY